MEERTPLTYELVDIASVEQLPDFEDEYVYDIEVDGCHNFFGNGLLVHNSIYVEFGRITRQLGIQKPGEDVDGDPEAHFICDLWNKGCGVFMTRCYEAYAKHYCTNGNKQNLELEKIARSTVLIAKKRYIMEESWKEPDIFMNKLEDMNYKGIELVQGATPRKIKNFMEDFYKTLMGWYYDHDDLPPYEMLVEKIKGYKRQFFLLSPDDMCKTTNVSDYGNYVLEDKGSLVFAKGAPAHARAAGFYNHFLYKRPDLLVKYAPIVDGKVKWYYAKGKGGCDVFAFPPNKFPMEIAPEIDRDDMFNKMLLDPLNRVISAIGHLPVPPSLAWCSALF